MAETLGTLRTMVETLLRDEGQHLADEDNASIDFAIRAALEQYSHDAPRTIVADVSATGTFDLALPGGYVDGFSAIRSIEYPIGAHVPSLLERGQWVIYRAPSGPVLRLGFTPSADVRVTYTVPHTIDDLDSASETTINPMHTHAFVALATAKALQQLADKFLHEQEATLDADSVDRAGKSDQARRLIGTLLGLYRDTLGLSRGIRPGLLVVDWDTTIAGTGIDRLTHPRRRV